MDLPIIYVRGFAGGGSGIDKVVDDPFYGFNEGSVHVRVGKDSRPHFYQFESPLLRLITEWDYRLLVHGSQEAYLEQQPDGSVPAKSIWVHRFYDEAASTFAQEPQKYVLEEAAADLFRLVRSVKRKTGAPRVHLVAHSMGGLICRCLVQRVIPEQTRDGGELRLDAAVDHVQSLFTYGTPHGGIEFALGFGLFEKARDLLDINGAEIFGRRRMYDYLTPRPDPEVDGDPPEGWNETEMPAGGFPLDRVFCLVGTNPEDYAVAMGLSSKAVGARSDGLVQIDNAYVKGAHRAFVHRSHSGRYGLVNSEEGFQNLRRFVFGDLQVRVDLCGLQLPGTPEDGTVWQLETMLSVRGLPVRMHEQTTAHHCPIQIERPRVEDTSDTPRPLLTTFLSTREPRPLDDGRQCDTLRHALTLRLISLRESTGFFDFGDHLEQTADFEDTLVVDIAPPTTEQVSPRAWTAWNSDLPGAIRDWRPDGEPMRDERPEEAGLWQGTARFPAVFRATFGEQARLVLTVSARPGHEDDAPAGSDVALIGGAST
ncbi:esterase/lipase family protein [Blastococcus atacamensis]|uniref:esterase/lipase family protein n=1 Tax=Blastococcus atacamensis TaxID=2070508 RepID=UPI000DE37FCA|nr:alpha/beta hydrolase [Blastococcus atacamensis]